MSVKKKDRKVSKLIPLQKSRALMEYVLILTRPRTFNHEGKQTMKPGILGEGQAYQIFGFDIIKCAKAIHAKAYQASQVNIKNLETLQTKNVFHKEAIEYCDSILRQIDFCIFQYARNSKKKQNSFKHLAKLVLETKHEIQNRMNGDKIIYETYYINK